MSVNKAYSKKAYSQNAAPEVTRVLRMIDERIKFCNRNQENVDSSRAAEAQYLYEIIREEFPQ